MAESCEHDIILVPGAGSTYEHHPLMQLLGFSRRLLRSASGFGLAPLHFITQRGPFQDGATPLDMRLDVRTIQIVIAETIACRSEFWDRRYDILDLLRPNRSFNRNTGVITPLVYRKWLTAGHIQQGTDGIIENGEESLYSPNARFVHWGLDAGATVTVSNAIAGGDNGTFTVTSVPNDYTVMLNHTFANDETVHWQYRRGWGKRDLYCLLEEGPHFDMNAGGPPFTPGGYREALRFVAHDPTWYGLEQSQTWALPDELGDLVFDGDGAWLGDVAGIGRWLFFPTNVGVTVGLIYWGTVGAKPVIEINGPATDPVISNTTIGTTITVNYTIAFGETVYVDTLAQLVYNQAGDNLMPYVSGDLATFEISPPPQAPDRRNDMYVSFSEATAASFARLTWKNRYIGL